MTVSSKSTLAKLLATENLRVEHQKVQTAAFDLKNRTLILPIWKDMSNDLYDLLIGHEVGHALYTPAQGWHSEIDSRGAGLKSFLNILEDARIERKIKDKFPGIRRNFFAGYQELFNKDFFGVKDIDNRTLRFIDRINLHYKVGPFLNVQFSVDEQPYLARIDALETWEEVAALAVELYELAKSEPENDFTMPEMDEFLQEDEDGEDPSIGSGQQKSEETAAEKTAPEDGKGEGSEEKNEEGDADESGAPNPIPSEKSENDDEDVDGEGDAVGIKQDGSNDVPTFNDDPISITDQNFREMEDSFIDSSSREYAYGILRKVNVKDYVIPMDWVVDAMKPTVYVERYCSTPLDYDTIAAETFQEFRKTNQKYINLMAQEFELRRRASEFARAQTSKTGRLDMNRVWAHKISEDLFARNTVVPDGKNHGMLLFLDMSGSMAGNMKGTIEQLVTLMMFCRKVRIPFEVYGFTNNHTLVNGYGSYPKAEQMITNRNNRKSSDKEMVIGCNSFFLMQFATSNCSAGKFNEVVRNLLMVAKGFGRKRYRYSSDAMFFRLPECMALSSTPLEESILVGRTIADEFRKRNRVEVLNTVFMTDGDGDNNVNVANKYGRYHITATDADTGATATVKYTDGNRNQSQQVLLELYKKATGSRMINFFIAESYCAKRVAQKLHQYGSDFNEKWRSEWKNKYFHTTGSFGFDDRFLIPGGNDLSIGEDVLDTDSTDPKELRKAFGKFQNKKQSNRILLTKMIQAVA